MKRTIITLLLLMLLIPAFSINVWANPFTDSDMEIYVKVSPQSPFYSKMTIEWNETLDFTNLSSRKEDIPPISDTYVLLKQKGKSTLYILNEAGNLYDAKRHFTLTLPVQSKKKIMDNAYALRSAHYGEMLPWDRAKKIFNRKSIFTVTDLETGLSFNVQRRAGHNHADVQPLTKKDSAIMKKIYNGKWSWNRRAIVVTKDHRMVAASMHGMPHGGDGIPDNNFSGHFCIHFLDSATHGSGKVDVVHQLMVYKAAGKLDVYFRKASPYQVIDSFIVAIRQKDPFLLKRTFTESTHEQILHFTEEMNGLVDIRKRKSPEMKDVTELFAVEIPVELDIVREGKKSTETWTIQLRRNTVVDPWKIEAVLF